MTTSIDITKQRSSQTRVELTLTRIISFWNVSQNGARFARELMDFLRAIDNKNTLQSYCFSVLEFFDWYQKNFGTIVTPDKIRRADAVDYSKWLKSREIGLEDWRVHQDPERTLDARILDIVKKFPGCDIRHIREELGKFPDLTTLRQIQDPDGNFTTMRVLYLDADVEKTGGLAKRLACLVSVKNLVRTPSINQIRAKLTDINLGPIDPTRVGIDFKADPGIFKYYLPRQTRDEIERSGTVVARLSALSSLWEYFRNSGENTGAEAQLIKHNIWEDPLSPVLEQARSQAEVSRAQKTPDVSVIDRLISTTFQDTFRDKSLQAAQAKLRGYQVRVPIRRTSFSDMRDRALLILMVTTGLRAIEVTRVKRGDISGTPPMMEVTGKRNKKRLLALPPVAYLAISELEQKIQVMAENRVKYGSGSSLHAARLSPDAPLIPAVIYWGKNAGTDIYKGLTRQAISAILKRRSLKAGLPPGTIEYTQAHPHGLRHLFAHIAVDTGTKIHDLQAMMGHASMSTTGRYTEQRRPEALMAEAFKPRVPLQAQPSITFQAPLAPMMPVVAGVQAQVPVAFAEPIVPPTAIREKPAKPKQLKTIEITRQPIETPVLPEVQKRTGKEISAVSFIEKIYESNWGERRNRQRLGSGQKSKKPPEEKITKELSIEEEALEAAKGVERFLAVHEAEEKEKPGDIALETTDTPKKLNQIYVGNKSGFLWWAGPGGKLKPEMPVISPAQALNCTSEAQSDVCAGLTGLWKSWMANDEYGPMAASALVSWVARALNISALVNKEAIGRGAKFLPVDSPVESTEALKDESGEDRHTFRDHDPAKIIDWFNRVAWQYRVSEAGGHGKTETEKSRRDLDVIDTPIKTPGYYALEDPIKDLPDDERSELLDWLAAITGQPILDTKSRFQGASRAEVANLLRMMHQLGDMADDRWRAYNKDLDKDKASYIGRQMVTLDENIKAKIDEYTRGRVQDFSLKDFRREKVKKRLLKEEFIDTIRDRPTVFLNIIMDLFGLEAARDLVIRYAAKKPITGSVPCGATEKISKKERVPGINLVDFFRIKNGTIIHDEDVGVRFAKITGAHSECVARRVARDLWEIKKNPVKFKRITEIKNELPLLLCTHAEYRVPCPEKQQKELRVRLGFPTEPTPVYDAWARVAIRVQDVPAIEREFTKAWEQAEEESELTGGRQTGISKVEYNSNPRARVYRVNGTSAAALPSPIYLLMLIVYA